MTERERAELDSLIQATTRSVSYAAALREKQRPPAGDWRIWLLLAGRGFGKTLAITQWALTQARAMPKSRGALVAATAADARDVLVEGESGILNIAPPNFRPLYEPSKRRLTFPNGSQATLFSADEPNRLRGPQYHWAACDELAAWNSPDAFDQLLLGLRLGHDPRCAIATTPRPTAIIKRLLDDPTVVVVRGSTYENRDHLAPAFFTQIISRYEGTTLGRQEIEGEVIAETAGALWKLSQLEALRVTTLPGFKRIVVGIDPMGSKAAAHAEAGIVTAALGEDGHGYVLEDASLNGSPDEWARAALASFAKWKADRIVAEKNFGGDMVESTLRTVRANAPITMVTATRGKAVRAEPIAALYEQGKVHHVGTFRQLEDEMTTWTLQAGWSPNRLDALVWALTELMLKPEGFVFA